MAEDRVLASPNQMIWQYFELLRRQMNRLSSAEERLQQQECAVVVFLAITVLETFLNIYFRVVVSEPEFAEHEKLILGDLDTRKPLTVKIETWPEKVLGQRLSEETLEAFHRLRKLRNHLMHFTSSHEPLELPGPTIINGLADVSAYKRLDWGQAQQAFDTVLMVTKEIFLARGIPEDQVSHMLHGWFGKVPSNKSLKADAVNGVA